MQYTPDAEVLRARAASNPLANSSTLGAQVDALINGRMRRGLSKNQLAARVWYRCNGDLERRHTTGVYLRNGRTPQAAPVLGVYVDSHACLNDFTMRSDIYLSRLAVAGLEVSGVEFRLSRQEYVDRRTNAVRGQAAPTKKPLLAPLSREERAEAAEIAANLSPDVPQSLREKVSRVVELSMSREKASRGQK